MVEFSIVCPVRNEVDLIPKTLPSFYALYPSEVILCVDKPAPKDVTKVIDEVWILLMFIVSFVESLISPLAI